MFAAAKSGSASLLIIYVVVFGALYFFYLRPRSKKQKAQRLEAKKVEVGERAQTIGGIVGTVIRRDDSLVTLRTASGTEIDFVPSAIARRVDPVVTGGTPQSEGDDK
jgi:preprotein translocase subunit YajC